MADVVRLDGLEGSLEAGEKSCEYCSTEAGQSAGVKPLPATVAGVGNRVLLAFGIVQSFLNTGLIYGWPALVAVLKRDGAYLELCPPPLGANCEARLYRFSSIFIISQAVFR